MGAQYPDTQYSHSYFNGYIDEGIVTKGVARWTSNFDPITGNPVPVPSAIWLLGSGPLSLVGFRKFKR